MLDAKQTGLAAGDIKTAMNLIADNTKAEMVASINILKLAKGLSQMSQQMGVQGGSEMPDFWQDVKTDTTSCMAAAVFINNGIVRTGRFYRKNCGNRRRPDADSAEADELLSAETAQPPPVCATPSKNNQAIKTPVQMMVLSMIKTIVCTPTPSMALSLSPVRALSGRRSFHDKPVG
jgi:hypothetical protein